MATENLSLEAIELTDNMQTSMLQKMNGNMNKIDTAYGQLRDLLLARTGKDNLKDAIEYVEQLVNAQDATITPDKVFNGYVGYNGLERIEGTGLSTTTTGSASQLLSGKTLYDNFGSLVTGTMTNKANTSTSATGSVSGSNYMLRIPTNGYYATNSYLTRDKSDVLNDMGITPIPTINVSLTGNYASSTYIKGHGAAINNDGVLVIWAVPNTTSYEHICFTATSLGAGAKSMGWDISNFDTADPAGVVYACTVSGLSGYNTINITLNASTANSTYDYTQVDVTLTAS